MTYFFFFFFNDTATTEIYTLSLHDALPICLLDLLGDGRPHLVEDVVDLLAVDPHLVGEWDGLGVDRKSTRLNSSHGYISYAVFCLKKKRGRAMQWVVLVVCEDGCLVVRLVR